MNFNSTIYLTNFLIDHLALPLYQIENCMKVLTGFVVTPNSLKSHKDAPAVSFKAKIPGSKFQIFEIFIDKIEGISIYGKVRDYPQTSLHINLSLSSFCSKSVLIIDDDSTEAGIYYHSSSVLNAKQEAIEHIFFFDSVTLKMIKEYSAQTSISFDDIIQNKHESLARLGFMPDNTLTKKDEYANMDERARCINAVIRGLNRESIINFIVDAHISPQEQYRPISL